MEFRDGGPAFPQSVAADALGGLTVSYDAQDGAGMSLRDYFAAQALPAVIARGIPSTELVKHDDETWGAGEFARRAYLIANAMIAEREKQA